MTTAEHDHDKAQQELDTAIEKYFKDCGWEGFITGWVLVAHQHRLNPETGKVEDSAHPLAYMGGTMPDHIAIGLITTARDIIRGVGRWAHTEDEE